MDLAAGVANRPGWREGRAGNLGFWWPGVVAYAMVPVFLGFLFSSAAILHWEANI